MKGIRLDKNDYKLTLTETVIEPETKSKFEQHLCWENCKNAEPFKCGKVFDLPKKSIDAYPFIREGYQVFDENDKLTKFIVKRCNNYEREPEKMSNRQRTKKLRILSEQLALLYYGVDSLDEIDYIVNDEINDKIKKL